MAETFMISQLMIKSTGKGDENTKRCLLDYQYFKDHYQLIAADLSKQKELDADPRAIQPIEFYGKLGTDSQVCTVLEKSKETVLELITITPHSPTMLKTTNPDFSFTEIWITDQNNRPLKIEDNVNITLIIGIS